jgi:hypothetical protein
MKKPLDQLTEEEFNTLKSTGVLYDAYPNADKDWPDIQKHSSIVNILKKILASVDRYDIIKLKPLAKEWLKKYGEN